MASTNSPFWRSIDISHTAVLLSDVQNQLLVHMPEAEQHKYLSAVQALLASFREYITHARSVTSKGNEGGEKAVPVIIHHVVAMDFATMNLSPYNKINNWALRRLKAAAAGGGSKPVSTTSSSSDPAATVPSPLHPEGGWNVDEFVLTKQAPSCFISSSLVKILHARGIKHIVLVGLTTEGSILSTVRHGSDLDFHIVVPREGVWCDDEALGETVLEKLVPRFADVCEINDVKLLLGSVSK